MPRRRLAPVVTTTAGLALVALVATACSSSSSPSDAAGSSGSASATSGASTSGSATATNAGDPHLANVTITSDKCVADRATYAAGGLTVKVSNKDATGVTEVELLDGERIIGEKENLAPGFSGSFSINVQPGKYQLYCPGATTERVPFTVTGTTTSAPVTNTHQLLVQGTKDYGVYITSQVNLLVQNVTPLVAALKGKSLAAAQVAYAHSRAYYERVEPVAESFQDLDPAIDNRADDVPVSKLTGFHRIEYGLFQVKSLAGLGPIGDQLLANCKKLQTLTTKLTYQPAELANGAVSLLDEVSKSKVTGEEERYSHIDLLDFQANVEGSQQAFANLQPGLQTIDPALATSVTTAFNSLDTLLDKYRSKTQPSGFVLYTSLTKADVSALAAAVQAVAEPLSRVASKVVNA